MSGPLLLERVPDGRIFDTEVILDRFLSWVEACGLTPYDAQEEALLELATGRHLGARCGRTLGLTKNITASAMPARISIRADATKLATASAFHGVSSRT